MKRHNHDLGYEFKFTGKMGQIIPIGLTEVLPGDIIKHNVTTLIRSAPLTAPVMHPTRVLIAKIFVPTRLVWTDFADKFITGGPDGADATARPYITTPVSTGVVKGTLLDYLGVPTGVASRQVSAIPVRGFQTAVNQLFRDPDLQTEAVVSLGNGSDTTTSTAMRYACWRKDYFNAARPEPQKGPDITIPLGTRAPVRGIGKLNTTWSSTDQTVRETDGTGTVVYDSNTAIDPGSNDSRYYVEQDPDNAGFPNIWADLTQAIGITALAFRALMSVQRFQENRNNEGSRYFELLRSWGVRYSDATLQRVQLHGLTEETMQFSEVLQTSEAGTTPLGEMAGHGILPMGSGTQERYYEEHGFIHTLMIVRPTSVYANAIEKHWLRVTKDDYWNPEFEHIGQEAIEKQEVYFGSADPTGEFGYNDRYSSYRRGVSRIAGDFRDTLKNWHFARDFGSEPSLNSAFVSAEDVSVEPFADQDSDHLLCFVRHNMIAKRFVAKFATAKVL